MKLHSLRLLRKIFLPLFSFLNLGDITITHHFTETKFYLHTFRHKGYWFHGKKREKETMRFFADAIKPGDIVIEIGGHIGYISVYLSKLIGSTGKLFVFEPGKNNLIYLKKNTSNLANVIIVGEGAADIDGKLKLYMEDLTGQNNSFIRNYYVLLENSKKANLSPTISEKIVPVTKIDTLVNRESINPSLIKIDVEGFEFQVLKGMVDTLCTARPILMIEATLNCESIFDLLKDFAYSFYTPNLKEIKNRSEIKGNIFCLHSSIHRETMKKLHLR